MNETITITLDPGSQEFRDMQDACILDKTFTVQHGGFTYTGCRIISMSLDNSVGFVTAVAELAFYGDDIYGTNPEKHQGQDMKNWKFKSVHPKDIDFEELGASVTRQNPLALVRGQYTNDVPLKVFKRTETGNIVYDDGTVRTESGDLVIVETAPAAYAPYFKAAFIDDAAPVYVEETRKVTVDENYVAVHKSVYDKSLVANIDTPNFMLTNFRQTQAGHRVYGNVPTKDLAQWVKWAKDVKAAPWHDEDRRKVTFEVDLVSV